MKCAISSTSSVSVVLPGVKVHLNFSCSSLKSLQLNDGFSVGDLPRVGLEPRTIGEQTSAFTVRPFNLPIFL